MDESCVWNKTDCLLVLWPSVGPVASLGLLEDELVTVCLVGLLGGLHGVMCIKSTFPSTSTLPTYLLTTARV